MDPYIFGISVARGTFHDVYKTTPLPVFVSGPKKDKNGTLARQILIATDPNLDIHTLLVSGSNMGRSSSGHVRLKIVSIMSACLCVSTLSPKHQKKLNPLFTINTFYSQGCLLTTQDIFRVTV